MARNRKRKNGVPDFNDDSFLSDEFKGTKEFVKKALADGRLKRCSSCKRPIGRAYNICGLCEEVVKVEVIADEIRRVKEKTFY